MGEAHWEPVILEQTIKNVGSFSGEEFQPYILIMHFMELGDGEMALRRGTSRKLHALGTVIFGEGEGSQGFVLVAVVELKGS